MIGLLNVSQVDKLPGDGRSEVENRVETAPGILNISQPSDHRGIHGGSTNKNAADNGAVAVNEVSHASGRIIVQPDGVARAGGHAA